MRKIAVVRGACGIRYTDSAGNRRHATKTSANGAFLCEDDQAAHLVRMGAAKYVDVDQAEEASDEEEPDSDKEGSEPDGAEPDPGEAEEAEKPAEQAKAAKTAAAEKKAAAKKTATVKKAATTKKTTVTKAATKKEAAEEPEEEAPVISVSEPEA